MFLSSVKVVSFRNITRAVLTFDPGINILLGDNAQGKTSLLEAVLYLATCTSHRTFRDTELIQSGTESAFVGGTLEDEEGRQTHLEVGLSKTGKQIKVDGATLSRVGDLYGRLRVTLMAPEDLEIIGGSPRLRRKFLDLAIAQCDPAHIADLQEYNKVLRHRNAFLRAADPFSLDEAMLRVWDEQLVGAAVRPVLRRKATVAAMALELTERYGRLADGERVTLRYAPDLGAELLKENADPAEIYRAVLKAGRERDVMRGMTGRGPHRDDLALSVAGRDIRLYGSQGQRRTTALALRAAEAALIRTQTGAQPLLLADDVVYEMDGGRRRRFLEMIEQGAQVFLTATDLETVGPLAKRGKVFKVFQGGIEPA